MKRIGPPKIGVAKVAKIRRTSTQAYGTRSDWSIISAAVKKRDGHKCRLCPRVTYLQVDHIIPISKGGQTVMTNLWTLCDICHSKRPSSKCAKHLILHQRNKDKGKRL